MNNVTFSHHVPSNGFVTQVINSEIFHSSNKNPQYVNMFNGYVQETPNVDTKVDSANNEDFSVNAFSNFGEEVGIKCFEYNFLKAITNNFSEIPSTQDSLTGKLGCGNFGDVFKGSYIDNGHKKIIAVKRLNKYHGMDEKQFQNEVAILTL